ncbi:MULTISPECIES: DUF2268 domain-containing protein [Bacillaceae]|uniref:DUF2268 domain-containing protein n=1 Tax=Evansella alkalicola TaxID=745819 RepID=A0ABS6JX38_9BACI|nr:MULTISPECIES: DUF2268 domain-containing putative Zn-dependent protease [Bacillaceae]MBU9721797.1 DUF2268 domain-containing protein [Bacillus alkalicola]
MPLINIEEYINLLMNKTGRGIPYTSSKMSLFSKWNPDEMISFLYSQGMLPIEGFKVKWSDWVEELKASKFSFLDKEYGGLRKLYKGPDVDVFLFPINICNGSLMEEMNGKNGVSFNDGIALFFHKDISLKELQALFTHEYHHVCWLYFHQKDEESVTLLDSLIMEGLAEWEASARNGHDYYAPWTNLYSDKVLNEWWIRTIKNKRFITGRSNQFSYMYGGKFGLPKWIGYNIGLKMVESFMEKNKTLLPYDLLQLSSEEIYQGSVFHK